MLDDVLLHTDFILTEFIDIYERNQLDILQCALDDRSAWSHEWMKQQQAQHPIGRLTNMAEYFNYLMSAKAYARYYTCFLGPSTFWGWGCDFNLVHVAQLRVGILDKFPICHFIKGASYNPALPNPWDELARWTRHPYQCFESLR